MKNFYKLVNDDEAEYFERTEKPSVRVFLNKISKSLNPNMYECISKEAWLEVDFIVQTKINEDRPKGFKITAEYLNEVWSEIRNKLEEELKFTPNEFGRIYDQIRSYLAFYIPEKADDRGTKIDRVYYPNNPLPGIFGIRKIEKSCP